MAALTTTDDGDDRAGDLPALVKWGARRFEVAVRPGAPGARLKARLCALTGVPPARQKVMCGREVRHGWKGSLGDDAVVDPRLRLRRNKRALTLTLVGTAAGHEAPPPSAAAAAVTFEEDITPEERARAAARADAAALADCEGFIPALQRGPASRDDGKAVTYPYNFLVTGLPQRRIEYMLGQQREARAQGAPGLCGTDVAMTMGAELGKSFLTTLAVTADGTLVSGMDNGKLQFWRHGERVCEAVHDAAGMGGAAVVMGQPPGPVVCSVGLRRGCATGGSGSVKLWDSQGRARGMAAAFPGTTPVAMAFAARGGNGGRGGGGGGGGGGDARRHTDHLAVAFQRAQPDDPHEFRLVPQTEAQRARREAAIAERERRQERYQRHEAAVQVMAVTTTAAGEMSGAWTVVLDPRIVDPPRVTTLAALPAAAGAMVVVGGVDGTLRVWQGIEGLMPRRAPTTLQTVMTTGTEADGDDDLCALVPVCVEPLASATMVAVALGLAGEPHQGEGGGSSGLGVGDSAAVRMLRVPAAHAPTAVVVVDVVVGALISVLAGHAQDVVRCLCALPDGSLVTGGGKRDASVQLWTRDQWAGGDGGGGGGGGGGIRGGGGGSGGRSGRNSRSVGAGEGKVQAPDRPPIIHTAAARRLAEPGYVLALACLRDTKPGSDHFALAGARYNLVKIVL